MYLIRDVLLALSLLTCFWQAHGADKYTDENRPYEFGFNIEGEQHRHEKKDEKGLIMGEYGFITADGVYHVTVYATDENGKFRILSMKNIRVRPYPSGPERKAQGKSLQLPALPSPQAPAPVQQTLVTSAPQLDTSRAPFPSQTPVPSNIKSCSSCKIPTTTTTTQRPPAPPAPVKPIEQVSYNVGRGQTNYPQPPNQNPQQPSFPQQPSQQPNYLQQANYPQQPSQNTPQTPSYPQPNQDVTPPKYPQQQPNYQQPQDPVVNFPSSAPQQPISGIDNRIGFVDQQGPPQGVDTPQQQPPQSQAPAQPSRNPKQYQPEQPITKPVLTYAQMQIVSKDTDIYSKKPGEKEGLPPGVTKDTVTTLLYTFNYTVGFHGHHEEGYTNGAKKGYYFVTGRNGIRTRVDYEADEKGFRPKISQEVLDLISEDVPKPETEKDEKYGLKGYEFKWLYYPDTKSS